MSLPRLCIYSPCERYRYTLHRQWSDINTRTVMFLLLNPSTATDWDLDPTLTRCRNFAQSWGFGRMWVGNIFAFRSTCPKAMKAQHDPVGVDNDAYIAAMAREAHLVVAGWGNHGKHMKRSEYVRGGFSDLHCLSLTKDGEPRHPLYLRGDLQPRRLS